MTSSTTATRSPLHHALARQGHRLTEPRRAILEALSESASPLTVEELHARVPAQRVNRVTVYRTVNLLVSAGLVRAVDATRGGIRYELGEQFTGHHAFLICQGCGRVEKAEGCPITDDDLSRLSRRVRHAHQFRVVDHELRLLGLCQTCHA